MFQLFDELETEWDALTTVSEDGDDLVEAPRLEGATAFDGFFEWSASACATCAMCTAFKTQLFLPETLAAAAARIKFESPR